MVKGAGDQLPPAGVEAQTEDLGRVALEERYHQGRYQSAGIPGTDTTGITRYHTKYHAMYRTSYGTACDTVYDISRDAIYDTTYDTIYDATSNTICDSIVR